jgi:hypothetical protein
MKKILTTLLELAFLGLVVLFSVGLDEQLAGLEPADSPA